MLVIFGWLMNYNFSFGSINLVLSHMILTNLYIPSCMFQSFLDHVDFGMKVQKSEWVSVESLSCIIWHGNLHQSSLYTKHTKVFK